MEQYLIDTNAICDYLSASLSTKAMELIDLIIDTRPNISVITQIELLCWTTDEATTKSVQNFISDSVVLNISHEVISKCVELRKNKKIKTPDAIIAATALANGFTLITSNEKDFANVKGLKIVNPQSL